MMEIMDVLQALFRWIHIVAGIIWIGLLYFFNFVNGPFEGTLDGARQEEGGARSSGRARSTGSAGAPRGRG